MTPAAPSPIEQAFGRLGTASIGWRNGIGEPDGPGWIRGDALRDAGRGPFHDLLVAIGRQLGTPDRRTVSASFAMRYGYASGLAIAPFLRCGVVPEVGLDNVSFRFPSSTFYERATLHVPRGTVVAEDPRESHRSMTTVADGAQLLRALRQTLAAQSEPVVEALFAWAGFARRGTWGMLTSAWATQFTTLADDPDDHRGVAPLIEALFEGTDVIAVTRPRLHAVTCGTTTHLFQRRASCCRYYLLPQGDLCASCPLVADAERLRRNLHWMQTQADRRGLPGH